MLFRVFVGFLEGFLRVFSGVSLRFLVGFLRGSLRLFWGLLGVVFGLFSVL